MPYIGQLLGHLIFPGAFKMGLAEIFGADTKPTEAELADYYSVFRHRGGNLVTYRVIDYIRQRNANVERWVGALQQTQVPVHMIYGPADPVNPPPFIDHYKRTVPRASIDVLPGVGHYPQVEAPGPMLTAYVAFLRAADHVQGVYPESPVGET